MYIFYISPLSSLFRNFYRSRFPSLWRQFDALVADGRVTSTREVLSELDRYAHDYEQWIHDHRYIFTIPTAAEGRIIREIHAVRHFQHNVEQKKIQAGG